MVEATESGSSVPFAFVNSDWLKETINDFLKKVASRGNDQIYQKYSLFDWLLVILRIKTIFMELCEQKGIEIPKKDLHELQEDGLFSQQLNYLTHFTQAINKDKDKELLQQVYSKFFLEQDYQKIWKKSGPSLCVFMKKHRNRHIGNYPKKIPRNVFPFADFFTDFESASDDGLSIVAEDGCPKLTQTQFFIDIIMLDLFETPKKKNITVWQDLRVSKKLFKFFVRNNLLQQKKVQNLSLSQKFLTVVQNLVLGFWGDTDKNSLLYRNLCFQFAFYESPFIIRAQPRRIVIYESDKKLKQPKSCTGEKPVKFCYYQFLELEDFVMDEMTGLKKERRIRHYNYCEVAKFCYVENFQFAITFINRCKSQKYYKSLQLKDDVLLDHPNRITCFKPKYVLTNVPPHQRDSVANIIDNKFNLVYDSKRYTWRFMPHEFSDAKIPVELIDGFKRNYSYPYKGEFVNLNEFKQFKDKYKQADDNVVDQLSEKQGSDQLLKLIKSIPKIKFQLTNSQELMISTPQNLLCLGRSGTGKTTSSALRLFATDCFYKYNESVSEFKAKNPGKRFGFSQLKHNFMDVPSKLKLVFCSASPVLVNEIRRFYLDFKQHFSIQFEKAQNRRQALAAAKQETSKHGEELKSQNKTISDKAAVDEHLENKDLLREYIRLELQQIESDEHLKQQESLAQSMDGLKNDDFPLFVTVKRLIYMLDASTAFPFFARDSQGRQLGLDANVEWHNEQGGVFMINQYHKELGSFDKMIKELGKKIIDFSDDVEEETYFVQKDEFVVDAYEEVKHDEEEGTQQQANDNQLMSFMQVQHETTGKHYSLRSQNLSFEVDYTIFENRFWPRECNAVSNLTPLVIWTEICSEIKGSAESYKHEEGGLPMSDYMRKGNKKKNNFLSSKERAQVYMVFLKYERWKSQMRAYDFNDVVNHILRQLRGDYIQNLAQKVHFLMVDEVQDCTQNMITLLMNLVERNIFFSGDTAQTISKGVGFRFFDLKSVFSRANYDLASYGLNFEVPKVLLLNKNFRSHSKILDLANSVVSLLELCFPMTIDKLLKETSDLDGPKPIVIDPCDKQKLEKILGHLQIWGSKADSEANDEQEGNQKAHFGCDRVVIVRDQESKASVPDFMRNMLCLTVYEAKGLEFDEVILYNFFQDSTCEGQWKLLEDVKVLQNIVKKKVIADLFDFDMLDIKELENEEQNDLNKVEEEKKEDPDVKIISTEDQSQGVTTNFELQADSKEITSVKVDGDYEIETKLELNAHFSSVYRKFAKLCTELKLLYVAITRPKNILLIYDDDASFRKPIQTYWRKVGAIDEIDKHLSANLEALPQNLKLALRLTVESSNFEDYDKEEVQLKWRLQGFKLFKVKYYQAAIQCFQNSGDLDLMKRCQAFEYADKAQALRGQASSKLALQRDQHNMLNKRERQQYKKEAIQLTEESKSLLSQAGHIFEQINMNQQAAQCFFSAGDQEAAAELFFNMKKYGQAAECFQNIGQIRKAANLYAMASLFANSFECYEKLEDWDGLVQCLHKYREKFSEAEQEAYIQKYFPIALNSVILKYGQIESDGRSNSVFDGPTNGLDDQNKEKMQMIKLKMKFQRSVSVIREDEEVDENSDSDNERDEELEQAKSGDQEKQKHEDDEKNQIELLNEVDEEKIPEGVVIIDTSDKNNAQIEKKAVEESFEIIESSQFPAGEEEIKGENTDETKQQDEKTEQEDFGKEENQALQLEILSNIDPEDEFLRSEKSYSLIQSMTDQSSDFSVLSAQSSGFSIISGSKVHSVLSQIQSEIQKDGDETLSLASLCGLDLQSMQSSDNSSLRDKFDESRYSIVKSAYYDTDSDDLIIQKVIFYISMFKEEINQKVKKLDLMGDDPLSQAVSSLENAKETKAESITNAQFEEDMNFMMIELDEIDKDTLQMILLALEQLELYRLCLIICNKFKLAQKAKYVSVISQKYSNLGLMKLDAFDVLKSKFKLEAQMKYALIAQEAMHNVLVAANFSHDTKSLETRDLCFESMFLQGFWKKLVYMMDTYSSLQLCQAMNNTQTFKLNYMVEILGLTDKDKILNAIKTHEGFVDIYIRSLKDSTIQNVNDVLNLFKQEQDEGESIYINDFLAQTEIKEIMHGPNWQDFFKKNFAQDRSSSKKINPIQAFILCDFISNSKQNRQNQHNFFSKAGLSNIILEGCEKIINLRQLPSKVLRTALKAFGVTWLDQFELFKNLSSDYCLLDTETTNQKVVDLIRTYHYSQLDQVKNQIVADIIADWYQVQAQAISFQSYLRSSFTVRVNKLSPTSGYASQIQIAFPCDIEMRFFLVPKNWIIEAVQQQIVQFTMDCISHSGQYVNQNTNSVRILNLRKQIQQKIQLCHNQSPMKYFFKKIQYSTHLTSLMGQNVQINPTKVSAQLDHIQIGIKMLENFINAGGFPKIDSGKQIRKVPKFKTFTKTGDPNFNLELMYAHDKAREALKNVANSNFFEQIFHAFCRFVEIDAYIIFYEMIKAQKQVYVKTNPKSTLIKKFNSVYNLIDAHSYSKLNDYQALTTSLLQFLHDAIDSLTCEQSTFLILKVFYSCLFSQKIFSYKETKEGVSLPRKAYQYIEEGSPDASVLKIPTIVIKGPTTWKNLKLSLQWMANLITSLDEHLELGDNRSILADGAMMLESLCRNLTTDEIAQLKDEIVNLAKIIVKNANYWAKGGEAMVEALSNLKGLQYSDKIKKLCQAVVNQSIFAQVVIGFQLGANHSNEIKREVKQVDAASAIFAELQVAGKFEEILMTQRKEAAQKIFKIWTEKRNTRNRKINIGLAPSNINQKAFHNAKSLFNDITKIFDDLSDLQKHSIVLLGTTQVNNAVDLTAMVNVLNKLTNLRTELAIAINSEFGLTQQISAFQKDKMTQLLKKVQEYTQKSKTWIVENIENKKEFQFFEQSKQRYIKLEKWNSVVQFHRKKKILLRHLKANIPKQK